MTARSPVPRRAHPAAGPHRLLAVLLLCVLGLALAFALGPGIGAATPSSIRAEDGPTADARLAVAATPARAWTAPAAGVRPGDVLRPFAAPERPWGRGHRGVDLAVSPGAAVLAPAAGTVVFAGTVVDRPVVTLEHADGTRSSLEPVEAAAPVGARLERGAPLGTVADASAHCAVPCVHWGVRMPDGWRFGDATFDRYLDPLVLIGWSGPSVLWPHAAPPPAGPAPARE